MHKRRKKSAHDGVLATAAALENRGLAEVLSDARTGLRALKLPLPENNAELSALGELEARGQEEARKARIGKK